MPRNAYVEVEPLSSSSLLPRHTAVAPRDEPFPHILRPAAVDERLYGDLAAAFPAPETILGRRDGGMNNAAARMPFVKVQGNDGIAPVWRDFFTYHSSRHFWFDLLAAFEPVFRRRFPLAEQRMGKPFADWTILPRGIAGAADAWIDCQFVINTAVTKVTSVKTVHVDKRNTMFSGLFYLRDPLDDSIGGDLGLYKWRRDPRFLKYRMILPDDVDLVETVRYQPNLFIGFVNDPFAAHSVSPRSITQVPRRYINLIVETKFNVFDLPPVSPWVQVWHWRDVRRTGYRSIGGDRA